MKLTKRQLIKIIKEELTNINISEAGGYRVGDEWIRTPDEPRSFEQHYATRRTKDLDPTVIERPRATKVNIIKVPIYWKARGSMRSASALVAVDRGDPTKGVATTDETVTLNVDGNPVDHNQANVTHIEALDIWGVTEWS